MDAPQFAGASPSKTMDSTHVMSSIPGSQYGLKVKHLDDHCRWMMRAGRADTTIKKRRMYLQYLADFLGKDPFRATEANLERYQDSLNRDQIRYATAMITPYYNWIHAKGLRPDNPAALLVSPKSKRGIPRPIDDQDLEHVVRMASGQLRCWLLLAAYAGLRAKEIAYLCVEDFQGFDGYMFIHLHRTKGEVERVTALPMWVWRVIEISLPPSGPCWYRQRGTGPVTPQQVSQYSNDHIHKCGVQKTLHTLRHWAGTRGGETTENLRVVQDFLGHAKPETTAVYTFVRPTRIAVMVEQFPRIDLGEPTGGATLVAFDSAAADDRVPRGDNMDSGDSGVAA